MLSYCQYSIGSIRLNFGKSKPEATAQSLRTKELPVFVAQWQSSTSERAEKSRRAAYFRKNKHSVLQSYRVSVVDAGKLGNNVGCGLLGGSVTILPNSRIGLDFLGSGLLSF